MDTRIAELRYKEVISVEDGTRYGYVGDMEVDLDSGQVRALVVPGRRRFFGLLGREEDKVIPWWNGNRGHGTCSRVLCFAHSSFFSLDSLVFSRFSSRLPTITAAAATAARMTSRKML